MTTGGEAGTVLAINVAAEQNAPKPPAPATWPAAAHAPTANNDDVIDAVTERVLARLSDRVSHDAVRDIVSAIAERLIREEIERIKASIR